MNITTGGGNSMEKLMRRYPVLRLEKPKKAAA